MGEADEQVKKKMPKGGAKGGARFPQVNLTKALEYSKKMVAKTHTGPQPATTILPGVFNSSGGEGRVRASALRQYGLLEGPSSAYQSTNLAKQIDAAPESERNATLAQAFLSPKLFDEIFRTFHGDTILRSKIEQRARVLKVHPESSAACTQIFVESAVAAGLGRIDGDLVVLSQAPLSSGNSSLLDTEADGEGAVETESDQINGEQNPPAAESGKHIQSAMPAKTAINLTIDVDSSSDPDKLEKQLKLLRSFGLV